MIARLGNVIYRASAGAAVLFLLFAFMVSLAVMVFAYPVLWAVPYGGALTVWSLNRLVWRWKELKPLDRFWMIVTGGLLGPGLVMWSLIGGQKGNSALYVAILGDRFAPGRHHGGKVTQGAVVSVS